jgi:purine-binding chemotaxis protein CheW
MNSQNYLTFNLRELQYGIEASLVKEIFLLPELIPIAEAPIDIVGILNLREKIVPILHLDLRLGNPMQECKISDSVIVIEWEGLQLGIIVNDVKDIQSLQWSNIEMGMNYGRLSYINPVFIAGIAKVDSHEIVLLNSEALVRQPDAVEALVAQTTIEEEDSRKTIRVISNFYDLCCPNATPEERAIFRRRTDNLRTANLEHFSDTSEQIPVAVVGLGSEYFGIDLNAVREFINVRHYTPIPCCPKHIVGNMNLRGEILTLVDIRSALNLNAIAVNRRSQAVVIDVDDIVAGLPVDEVLDVMYLPPDSITPVPIAVDSGSDEYLHGMAPYSEKTIGIIDLPKLLAKGGLIVNEEV